MKMNDELNPCPVCGGEAELQKSHICNDKGCRYVYGIFCQHCGYTGGEFFYKESAVKMWNEEETK